MKYPIPPNENDAGIYLFGARQFARCQADAHLGIFVPAMRLPRGSTRALLVYCGHVRGWRPIPFPASGHLVGRQPAAITLEDHSEPCFVLEREHANDGVQISPQEQCRSRRRSLAPPFQRDDCGPRMKQISGQSQGYFRGSDRAMAHVSIYAPRNLISKEK